MKNLKNHGITLIALVITIIVLLILAGVSIKLVAGENGLISKARIAKEKTEGEGYIEQIELIRADLQMQDEHFQRPKLDSLNNALKTENWVESTVVKKEENPARIEVTTKEGYIIYVTETGTEYKGKGEVKDKTDENQEEECEKKTKGALEIVFVHVISECLYFWWRVCDRYADEG